MKAFLSPLVLAVLIAVPAPAGSTAQSSAEWRDELADHMIGTWKLEGKIMGRDAHHEVEAAWVLSHRFVRIHETTEDAAPASERRYEALWFLGYDPLSERYVLHLLDVFGGRFSETLGHGTRDRPFHTTLQWSPEKDTWQWLMTQKDKDGKWAEFGDLKLTRSPR
jgi:hypothetical protein